MPALQRELDHFMDGLRKRNPHQTEFHQAVEEVAGSVMPWYLQHDDYRRAQILERLTEPDRIIAFRVSWETDGGDIRANRAWRVQFNHALGPCKGGLRFHPTVTETVLKFLGFEQILKNSLAGLPMGGAKGGSNFNPKDKSEREVISARHTSRLPGDALGSRQRSRAGIAHPPVRSPSCTPRQHPAQFRPDSRA